MVGEKAPTNWRMVKLSDLGEVNRGRSRHRPRYVEHLYGGPYPFIQTGDIRASGGRITSHTQTYSEAGLAQSRLWPAGTMCITIAANIAETAILTYPACFPDSVVGFIADESKCSVHFVEYAFRNLRQRIQHEATGSVQDNINLGTLERLRFPLPPLAEQQAIACILGALDDKIELNRRMNETLEAMARAIFKSWFVDFDPVREKMERKDARTQGRKEEKQTNFFASLRPGALALNPAIADLFPDGFEESELGETPRGWETRTLAAICHKPQYGYTASANSDEIGPRFLRITDINKMPWIDWTTVPYCQISESDYQTYRLYVGDMLIARMADPGHGVIIEEQVEAVFASYLIRFRPRNASLDRYLQYWLRSPSYWDLVLSRQAGTTRPSLNAQVIGDFKLLVPPPNVAEAFKRAIDPLRSRIVTNVQQSNVLAALRDTLLPKLISGELRVPDAEKFVGAVV